MVISIRRRILAMIESLLHEEVVLAMSMLVDEDEGRVKSTFRARRVVNGTRH
jgi:hypothetical protein